MQRTVIVGLALATVLCAGRAGLAQYAANPNWNQPALFNLPHSTQLPPYPLYSAPQNQPTQLPSWSSGAWTPTSQAADRQPQWGTPPVDELGLAPPGGSPRERPASSALPWSSLPPQGGNWNATAPLAAAPGNCATGHGPADHNGVGQGYFSGFKPATQRANWIVGVNALAFQRTYEDVIGMSVVPGASSQYLTNRDADFDVFGGGEIFVQMRHCCGWGLEFSYWNLFADKEGRVLRGAPNTVLTGLGDLTYPDTAQNVMSIYDAGDFHLVNRENEFHNVELNFLKNAQCIRCFCKPVNVELIAGFRYLKFDERFEYFTYTTAAGFPSELSYILKTENNLLGFQLGCRTDCCITRCLRMNLGAKFGVYGNRIDYTQFIHCDGTFAQVIGGPYAGSDYAVINRKDTVSFLGELDFGFGYQFARCWRANFGYRAIALCGLALAPDQIPRDFSNLTDVKRINSSGCLILHGAYLGLERCF